MNKKEKALVAEEKAKIKALSRVRMFWLTLGLDIALIILIVLEVAFLMD